MVQRLWRHVPGTAVFVTVWRAKRAGLFFVRIERRRRQAAAAATVVVVQPRLEARRIAAAARLLRPKVKVLLVEIAVVVPDDDHVIRLEKHVQALVELHPALVFAGLGGRLGAAPAAATACCARAFQCRFFGLFRRIAAVAQLLLHLFVRCGGGRRLRRRRQRLLLRIVFLLLLFHGRRLDDGGGGVDDGDGGQTAIFGATHMAAACSVIRPKAVAVIALRIVASSSPSPSPPSSAFPAPLPSGQRPNGEAATTVNTAKTTSDFVYMQRGYSDVGRGWGDVQTDGTRARARPPARES